MFVEGYYCIIMIRLGEKECDDVLYAKHTQIDILSDILHNGVAKVEDYPSDLAKDLIQRGFIEKKGNTYSPVIKTDFNDFLKRSIDYCSQQTLKRTRAHFFEVGADLDEEVLKQYKKNRKEIKRFLQQLKDFSQM